MRKYKRAIKSQWLSISKNFSNYYIIVSLLILSIPAFSQFTPPYLVEDLNKTETAGLPCCYPRDQQLIAFKNKVYFIGETEREGRELWVSDGSSAGTEMLIDAKKGEEGSSPYNLRSHNDKLFFTAPSVSGTIWESDGTKEGTKRSPLSDDSRFLYQGFKFVEMNETFFFVGVDQSKNPATLALFKTDGTSQNTVQLTDFSADSSLEIYRIYKVNNTLYFFTAINDEHRRQVFSVWSTDGFTVKLLKSNIYGVPDTAESITYLNGSVYFQTTNKYLWKTDNTPEGTVLFRDTNPNNIRVTEPQQKLKSFNNKLFYSQITPSYASYECILYSYDHSSELQYSLGIISSGGRLIEFNDKLYYPATVFLRSTTGAPFSTQQLSDKFRITGEMVVFKNHLVYAGYNQDLKSGIELFKLDVNNNFSLIKDVASGEPTDIISSLPSYLTISNNQLFFLADDNIHGRELWITDLTNTRLVKNINQNRETGSLGLIDSNKSVLQEGNSLFFIATNQSINAGGDFVNSKLFVYDHSTNKISNRHNFQNYYPTIYKMFKNRLIVDTFDGVSLISDADDYSSFKVIPRINGMNWEFNGELFFREPYSSDGRIKRLKEDGVVYTTTIPLNYFKSLNILNQQGLVFAVSNPFSASNRVLSLWDYDKASNQVSKIIDLGSIDYDDYYYDDYTLRHIYQDYMVNSTKLFFYTFDQASNSFLLWVSDGTAVGTIVIKTFDSVRPKFLEIINEKLILNVNNSIWQSDGSASGTTLVHSFDEGDEFSKYKKFENKLLFTVAKPLFTITQHLWVYNGGTQTVSRVFDTDIGSYDVIRNQNEYFVSTIPQSCPGPIYKCDENFNNCTVLIGEFCDHDRYDNLMSIGNNYILSDSEYNIRVFNYNNLLKNDLWHGSNKYFGSYRFGNSLVFFGNANRAGTELWRLDFGCKQNISLETINNVNFRNSMTVRAGKTIEARSKLSSVNVTYEAPNSISLLPGFEVGGFEVSGYSVFETNLNGCPN
jgi:ELWxxDGT repeat protein